MKVTKIKETSEEAVFINQLRDACYQASYNAG